MEIKYIYLILIFQRTYIYVDKITPVLQKKYHYAYEMNGNLRKEEHFKHEN